MSTKQSNKPFFWRSQRDGTSFVGLDLAVWTYRVLGRHAVKVPLFFIATGVWLFAPRVRNFSKDYLRRLRAFAKESNIALPRNNSWLHIYRFAQAVLERVLAWHGLVAYKDLDSIDGAITRMQAELASPRGAVILGAHIGSIEMLRAIMKVCGGCARRVNIIMETSGNARFMAYLKKVHAGSATDFIAVDDITPATAMELEERVANGEWVVLLADRLPHKDARALKVPFLGSGALIPEGPWILAQLLKVPVFSLFAVKEQQRFKVYFKALGEIKASRKNRHEALEKKAKEFAKEMEQILLVAPLDWFNFYDYFVDDLVDEAKGATDVTDGALKGAAESGLIGDGVKPNTNLKSNLSANLSANSELNSNNETLK